MSGPVLLVATPLYLGALPATLMATGLYDTTKGQRLTASRYALALAVNLSMHTAAFAGMFGAWLVGARWAGADGEREARIEQGLQQIWARATWIFTSLLYEMDLKIEGAECLRSGPLLVLPRHASLIDTLLPLLISPASSTLRLRYVMKRELLWDPILDAIGHRWPTAFVRRGTGDPRERDKIVHLADDLGPADAVVLFPEGTRFTEGKREKILQSLRDEDLRRYERAARLSHLLPPHPGGVLALLDAVDADVAFVAHTGLEGANHFKDLIEGALIGSHVRVKVWRVPRADIPTGRSARIAWLEDQWEQVDRWIDAQHAPTAQS